MNSKKIVITSLLILSALLMTSFSTIPVVGGHDATASARPTRAAGENLEIENRTYKVSYLTGSEEWDTVYIRDNATLMIEGATLKAKKVICRDEMVNTALRIINHEGTQGLLSITEGILNVKADTIEILGSRISVVNGTTTIPNGANGGNSEISLLAESSDLTITDSEFMVRGHDGGLGDISNYGGKGGKAYMFLGAKPSNKVMVTRSDFQIEGGAGGNGFERGSGAGEGGEANFDINAEVIDIKNSELITKGGKAGARSEANPGNFGGNSFIDIRSGNDNYIYATYMESDVGINTNDEPPKQSFIILKSDNRKVLWDHQKVEAEKMEVLSQVVADTLNVDSRTGAELHQVDTGLITPQPLGAGSLKVFWWARITVKDKYNEPINNAAITYTIAPDPVPYPREGPIIETDDDGKIDLEIVARENQDWNKYTFQAEDFGGAVGTSDQYRFDSNSNLDIPIEIVRMTIGVVEPDLTKPVGGPVDFRGTAVPGNPQNTVQNVTLYVDQEVIGYGVDVSEEGAPPFSLWELKDWDSTTVPDGDHELLVIGIDSAYQVRFRRNFEVDQDSINHKPLFDKVIIHDRLGSYELEPRQKADIHVNQDESTIGFEVEVFEKDMLSTILLLGQGIKVIKATVDLIHVPSGAVILNDKVIGEDDIEKINLSGGYGFSFEVDANKRPGLDEPFPEGEYKAVFWVEDDGGLISNEEWVFFDLFFDFFPWVYMYIEPNIRPATDPEFIEESFVVETVESHIYTARFNLTDSSDRDDPLWSNDPIQDRSWSNLRFTVEVMDPEGNREVVFGPESKGAGFIHEFDVTDVKAGEQGIFTLLITCKDQEDLESTLRLKIRITHDPPPEELGIFGQKVGLPGTLMVVISPTLLVIMILAFAVMFFMVQKKNNDDKNKKMELLERKRKEEEKEKGSSAIEDEFTGGRIKDSRSYLKSSGGEKGKDEFAKELKAAQGKDVETGQLPGKEQAELPPAKPQEVKPPQPPKPGQAPQVPQQQPPVPPKPQAAVQPPPPAVQGPPTSAAPPQQQPPAPPAPQVPRPPAGQPVPRPQVPPAAPADQAPAAPPAPPVPKPIQPKE
ncbi:MAG: hypothetical protein ACMUHU_03935 [Thermoplasmatota archaeon]